MDESEALQQDVGVATPIFNVYRRGYDPEQVDRYVADQQRRLDDATHRSSESERKLAAAVGQLRELHRRVAVYESEARNTQPPALDTLGDRVQRILQEAWEGAYNLRQEAEREVTDLREQVQAEVDAQRIQVADDVEELRQVASREAAELVDEATRRALELRDEMDRRRENYLEKVERDRQRAVSQIAFLYDQRQLAISELVRLQATVQATVEEMIQSPLAKPAAAMADSAAARELAAMAAEAEHPVPEPVAAAAWDSRSALDPAPLPGSSASYGAGEDTSAYEAWQPHTPEHARAEPVSTYEAYEPAPEQSSPGSLFEEIIDEPTGAIDPAFEDVTAPWDRDTTDVAGANYADPTASYAGPTANYADPTANYADPMAGRAQPMSTYADPNVNYADPTANYADPAATSYSGPAVDEVPTGPMDLVDYGYDTPISSSDDEPARPATRNDDSPRGYGGVYDAEADGWG